jgi:two-component system cell cycle sensor histidine kinase/response regulator CckA
MKDGSKTKKQLIDELVSLRQQLADLKGSEAVRNKLLLDLKLSEERMKYLISLSPVTIYTCRPSGDYGATYISSNITDQMGYEPHEFTSDTLFWADHIHSEDRERVFDDIGSLFERGYHIHVYRFLHKDGSYRWMYDDSRLIRDDKDNPVEIIGFWMDITDMKFAGKKIAESEKKYREFADLLPQIVFEANIQGHLTFINRSALTMSGYTQEDIEKGLNMIHTIIPEERDRARENVQRVLAGERSVGHEYTFLRKDGSTFPVIIHTSAVIRDEHIVGLRGFAIDITERRKAEEELRRSEAKLQSLFRAAPIGIGIVVDRIIKDANEQLCRMVGYNNGELLGQSARILYPSDDDYNYVGEEKYEQIRKWGTGTVETRWQRKDGRIINVILSSSPLDNADWSYGVMFTALEITDRKRAEEEVRKSEEKYRTIIENIQEGYHEVDIKGNFTFFNESMCKIMGYKREELMGMNNRQYADEENTRKVYQVYNRVYRTGEPVKNLEWQIIRKNGDHRDVEVSVSLIGDVGDNPTGFRGIVRDITDRKHAEYELRESRRRLADIIEFLPDATLVIDKEGTIIAWNRAIEVMTGVKAEEMLGKGNYEYALPFYGERRPILIDLALHPDPEREKEYTAIRRTGESILGEAYTPNLSPGNIHLSGTASVLRNSSGEIIAAIECLRDNTERKRLESQLQQAQKMEAIGTLAGGIAHDFNNLLMAIQGNASLMLIHTDASDPCYEKLKAIEDQVVTGADLTKQLLGFARIGRYELKPMDLNEIVEKSSTMFARAKKEIVINKKYEHVLWAVEADASQIEQVLMNLYVNAWQAMPGGGHIYLETANVVFTEGDERSSYLKPGRYVKISVTDTGVGMDEKTKERIFEPFFTTKEMGRGTGLGLAMVYGIVKGHKGYINVYSEKGIGATFNIYLPASEKDALKGEKPEELILKGQETILLVDDEEIVMNVMKEILEALGYHILAAKNGQDAMTIYELNKDKIDLVILDMVMPEMGGGKIFDHLKEINPEIKVILSSGYSLNGEAAGIMARGCRGFIQKPATMANLSQKVREVLGKA